MKNKIYRIIDVNANRTKEGARVCEDIARFIIDDKKITGEFKKLRHQVTTALKTLRIPPSELIASRSSKDDVGSPSTLDELAKRDVAHLLYANLQRTKESLRVLEEFSKLLNRQASVKFKKLRFKIYELEKEVNKKVSAIPYYRQKH